MEISFNYDSDETYLSEGERLLEENQKTDHEIKSKFNDEKSFNSIKKVRKNISLKGIRNKIEIIKKCLNKWFEKNEGLPKYLLKEYISYLTKFKLIANQKIKAENLKETEKDLWHEVFQVSDKLKGIVEYIIKRSELTNSQIIDESDTCDNDEIIIEEETANTNGYISKKDAPNKIHSNCIIEPASKKEKIDEKNAFENDNLRQNFNDLSLEYTVIPSSIHEKPNIWKNNNYKKVPNKKTFKSSNCNHNKVENKKKNKEINEFKNTKSFVNNQNEIESGEMSSGVLKNSSQNEIFKIPDNEIIKMNKIPGEISLSQMSRHLSPNYSKKLNKKDNCQKYLFSKFWPHSDMEYLNHEILWPTLWQNNGKIPEEFYKDLIWKEKLNKNI